MKVWSLVSQKGGSGKSTLSVQLAVLASQSGEKAIVVDLDPQGSAELWYNVRGGLEPGAIGSTLENFHKVCDGARAFGVTLLIIDTPPHTDKAALEAIKASDLIICPTQSSIFDVWALRDTVALLDLCNAKQRAIAVINGLPTSGTQEAYNEAAAAITDMNLKFAKSGIGHRKPFVTSINNGKGVTEMFPGDKAAAELRALYAEITEASDMPPQRGQKKTSKSKAKA